MNILIIEDELLIQKFLTDIIKKTYYAWNVDVCSTYDDAVNLALKNSYDAFIIDYDLQSLNPDKNGLTLGIYLSTISKYKNTPFIFETSSHEIVYDAINKLNCMYFLKKIYTEAAVIDMLDKLSAGESLPKNISLKDEFGVVAYISVDDIIYIESNRHRMTLVLPETTFICVGHSLESISKLCGGQLVRCHKSFLVNKTHITHIDKLHKYVTLKNPSHDKTYTLKLGRSYTQYMPN